MTATQPSVIVSGGHAVTLSTAVATYFGKNHADVLKKIDNICTSLPADRLSNFAETIVTRANPKGDGEIESRAYLLTRDGFTFHAMGFTGKKAQAFKWAYIDAFNKMEQQLRNKNISRVSPATAMNMLSLIRMAGKRWESLEKAYEMLRAVHSPYAAELYDVKCELHTLGILCKDIGKKIDNYFATTKIA